MWLLAASPGACVDSHPQCSDFAALGECESNAASMRTLCARSCDFCRDPAAPACHDRRQECPVWTRLGLCARVPQAMLEACPASCDRCAEYQRARAALEPAAAQ